MELRIFRLVVFLVASSAIGFGSYSAYCLYMENSLQSVVELNYRSLTDARVKCSENRTPTDCKFSEMFKKDFDESVLIRNQYSDKKQNAFLLSVVMPLVLIFFYFGGRWVTNGQLFPLLPANLASAWRRTECTGAKRPGTQSFKHGISERPMVIALERLGWIVLTAIVVCFPATVFVFTQQELAAPLWYLFLAGVMGALGAGLIPIFFGSIALVAGRDRADGHVKAAIIITIVASVFVSYLLVRGHYLFNKMMGLS